MTERDRRIWLIAAGFGVLFALLNFVNLAFVGGDVMRDVVAIALGVLMTVLAYARSRGWRGVRR